MSETIRTFIAIELSDSIRQELSQIQNELKKSGCDAKWVKPENIHLTLKFLGATPIDKIEAINQILQDIANGYPGFEISIANLGAFPKIESPRVIWVDILMGKEILAKLAGEIAENLVSLGFAKEESAFQTHITLARLKSSLNRLSLTEKLRQTSVPMLNQKVDKITLLKSTLTPKGPIYEILKEINLKAS